MLGLIGKKIGMTQRFSDDGEAIPVTVVQAGPCTVVQVRTKDHDGYDALQVGFGSKREKLASKAVKGHAEKSGRGPFAVLAEFRLDKPGDYEVGQELLVGDLFRNGDMVDVTGTTKGRGFAGVVKRYGFAGQSATHGTHESFRGGGAIGACAYPGRVFKGKRMPGRMGGVRRTVQNLQVVEVVSEDNVLLIRGAVPGGRDSQVVLRPAIKAAG